MAGNVKGITVEIGGDVTKLDSALEKFQVKAKAIREELLFVNKALKFDPSNTVMVTQKQELLKQSITNTKEKLALLEAAQKQADEAMQSGTEIDQEAYRKLQRQIELAKQDLAKLDSESRSMSGLGQLGTKLDAVGDKAVNAGKKMTMVSAAIVVIGAKAIAAAVDYESAFNGVRKTLNATESEYDQMSDAILKMSTEMPATASEIAGVAESAAQLGIKKDDILEFTKVMIDLGVSTNMTADEAATALAKFANITGMTADNYSRLGSVVVALGNDTAATESDIVDMATRLAASGELAGLTESQIMALAAAMSSVGIEAEAGGSAMSKVLKNIQVAVETNSSALQQYASVANMSAAEFSEAWSTDPIEALSAFIDGLNDTERNGKSATVILEEMGLTDVRLSNTLLSLASASGLLSDSINIADKAWEEDTALSKEAEKRYKETANQIQLAKNNITDLGIVLGSILLPYVNAFAKKIGAFASWIANLNEKTQKVIIVLLGMVAAIGPLLLIFGTLANAIAGLIRLWVIWPVMMLKLAPIIAAVKGAFTGMFTFLAANPIFLAIAAAIEILIAAFSHLWKTNDDFKNKIKDIWNKIKIAFKEFVDEVKSKLSSLENTFKKITDTIKKIWDGFCDYLAPVFIGVFSIVADYLEGIFGVLTGILDIFIGLFTGDWKQMLSGLKTVFSSTWDAITDILSDIGKILIAQLDVICGWFGTTWEDTWDKIQEVFSPVVDFIEEKISKLVDFFQNTFIPIFQSIKDAFTDAFDKIKKPVEDAMKSISDAFETVKQAWKDFKDILEKSGALDAIKAAWDSFISVLKDTLLPLIRDQIGPAFEGLKYILLAFAAVIGVGLSATLSIIVGLLTGIASFIAGVIQAISGVIQILSGIFQVIIGIVTGNGDTIKAGFKDIGSGIADVFGGLWEAVVGSIAGFISGCLSAAASVASGFAGSLSGLPAKAASIFASVASKISSAVASLPSQMVTLGANIISGIISGITSHANALYNSLKSLASHALAAAKKALGISSPSKVMADEVGKWIPAGIAKGITNNAQSALNAIGNLTDDITRVPVNIDGAISSTFGTQSAADATAQTTNKLQQLYDLAAQYFPQLLAATDTGIYLDGRTLIGGTMTYISDGLAVEVKKKERGR